MLGVAGEVGLPPPAGCCLTSLGEPLGGPSEKTPRLPRAAGLIFFSPAQASLAGGQKNTRHYCAGRFLWVEDGVRTHDL